MTGAAMYDVSRSGIVTVNGRRIGYVDRTERGFDRLGRQKQGRMWRWVRVGGASSPARFATRREAVAALLAQS